jgi:MFS transporter, NNP family, nitrate/nitrite transporter
MRRKVRVLSKPLILATISFAACFFVWGLISGTATSLREVFQLSPAEGAWLVAIPVLLGSIARIPMGMLTDRFGGRIVFSSLMLFSAAVCALLPFVHSKAELFATAFVLGLVGSSFAIGVGYVSRHTQPQRQGTALGVFGLGNIGQSIAVVLAPLIISQYGWPVVFQYSAVALGAWGALFFLLSDSKHSGQASRFGEMLSVLAKERMAWLLSAFYFLTFGGFIAFAVYLPTLLHDEFGLTAADAGFRTAGFVALATLMRPIGGWLSDRIGGARVLAGVFPSIALFALVLSWPSVIPFTVGALGCAALLGIGNGAVFKLVPEIFPDKVGTVTGLVGAIGGLGGFVPPLLLSFFRHELHLGWPAFALLSLYALCMWLANNRFLVSRQDVIEKAMPPDMVRAAARLRAGSMATLIAGVLVAAIVIGSRKLQNFDPALVIYTFASIFAAWGVTYHYYFWLQKPPTRRYWRRGWELFAATLPGSIFTLIRYSFTHIFAQNFIRRRSLLRWWMHQLLFWGCILAAAVTFPLAFGWIHFGRSPNNQMEYVPYLFGFPTTGFLLGTPIADITFHVLDIAALLVIAGVALAMWRRMRDEGAQAVQSFAMDLFPLFLLFAISTTGLALTASSLWFRGSFYDFLSILHAITVITALLFMPFGKFFHIFQRPAQLGVKLYQEVGATDPGTHCLRCGERFASKMHVDDLKEVLNELGFNYALGDGLHTWQDVCPPCKRKSLASTQLRLQGESNG